MRQSTKILLVMSGILAAFGLCLCIVSACLGMTFGTLRNMFRSGEEVFLDDVTLSQVEEALQVQADIVKSSGQDLIDAILG